jgi:hypothetical protein
VTYAAEKALLNEFRNDDDKIIIIIIIIIITTRTTTTTTTIPRIVSGLYVCVMLEILYVCEVWVMAITRAGFHERYI